MADPFAQLSKHRVVARLGTGGMAEVYLVLPERPDGFNKLQVLKLMRSDLSDGERPEFLQMFKDEARLAAKLNHPNIVQSFEVGEEAGLPFIVMEFLDGQSLHRIQQRRNEGAGFPLDMELFVLCQVLEGLEYAHHLTDYDGTPLHMVHRDVSPQNVFVTYSGQTKLVDFGVAKTLESSKTRAGVVKGKVAYMPPEQVRTGPIDGRADLFSVGVLLWEAIARQPMHADLTIYESLSRLVRGDLPKIRDIVPDVDPALERIVERALQIEPDQRYQDAETFRAELFAQLESRSKVRSRELGQAVAQLFASERTELNALIRRAVTSPPANSDTLPALDRPITRRMPNTQEPSSAAPVLVPSSTPTEKPLGLSRRSSIIWLSVAAAASAIVLLSIKSQSSDNREPVAVEASIAPATAPVDTAPVTPPPPSNIQLEITAEPKSAEIRLDGKPLGQNPYSAATVRDGRTHTLTVQAPGFVPVDKTVQFDTDLSVRLQLEKVNEKPDARSKPPAWQNNIKVRPKTPDVIEQHPAAPEPNSYRDLPPPTKRSKPSAQALDPVDPWN